MMEYLSKEEVFSKGIEFAGEVCFSGEYGQQVYTKDESEGGVPVDGILYEKYPNGNLCYYAFYHNGIPHGQRGRYYESGNIESSCVMDTGTIDGDYTEWYESGKLRIEKTCKYGLVLSMKRYDENGNVVEEKNGLTDGETRIYKRRVDIYEKQENQ